MGNAKGAVCKTGGSFYIAVRNNKKGISDKVKNREESKNMQQESQYLSEKEKTEKEELKDEKMESEKAEKEELKDGKTEKEKLEKEKQRTELIEKTGQVILNQNGKSQELHLISIIGEIEGHENLSNNSKTTKYEHILPSLAAIEDSKEIQGVLVLLNTMGGDVEAGLAIAEMIASLSKPTVSLVLGGSHSIGVPIAVSTDYSFIVPTGTMVIHPVRMNGTVIGVPQTFEYFKLIQDRITGFVCSHCKVNRQVFETLMTETGILTKDVGTILVGEEAVKHGIIDAVGGIDSAIAKLHEMIQG